MSAAAIARPASPPGRRHAGLGTTRLFWVFVIVVGVKVLFDLGQFISMLVEGEPRPMLHVTMWIVLLVADLAVAVVTRVLGNHLPNWLYWMFVAALALVALMDLAWGWGSADPGDDLTAATSAGVSLILAVPTRSGAEIITAVSGLTATLALGLVLGGGFVPAVAGSRINPAVDAMLALSQVLFIVLAATLVTAEFRRIVRRELEQILSHSTLTAPRLTVGIDQSAQLTRLDLAAESLLAAVADGRVQLPLGPEIARRAGQLATELRLHLLESRSKTWLDLAIAESELLSAAISVEDPSSSAGLLGTRQRSALLSALWLLTERRGSRGRTPTASATVEIGPPIPTPRAEQLSTLPITVTVPWAGRAGVNPGVWEHFAQVGRYLEANTDHGLAVEIHGLVATAGRVPRPRDTNGAGM